MKGDFMTTKVTAKEILLALDKKFPNPEWRLGWEVGNGCGSKCTRHADAIVINSFPSRNHESIGFEIKVNKNDLINELKKPEKADAFYNYCNSWFLVTPKGLITDDLLIPSNWGILEYQDGQLRQKQKAKSHKISAHDNGFICSFIRGVDRRNTYLYKKEKENIKEIVREELKKEFEMEIEGKLHDANEIIKKADLIKNETGIDILDVWSKNLVSTFKIAKKLLDKRMFFYSLDQDLKDLKLATEIVKSVYDKLIDEENPNENEEK